MFILRVKKRGFRGLKGVRIGCVMGYMFAKFCMWFLISWMNAMFN